MRPLRVLLIVILAALAVAPAALAGYDETTADGVDAGHSGFLQGGTLDRPPLEVAWSAKLGSTSSSPLIAGGRLFVLATDTGQSTPTLYALDIGTGAVQWRRPTGTAVLAYDQGVVAVSDGSGAVTGVDAATGATLWTTSLSEPFTLTGIVAQDGVLYVDEAWSGGRLHALDVHTGAEKWAASFYYGATPALAGRFVYLSDDYEGATAAFDRSSGARAWTGRDECFVGDGHAVASGAYVIGPYNTGCGMVNDAATGRVIATTSSWARPALVGDTMLRLNGTSLEASVLHNGVLAWRFTPPAGDTLIGSPPLVVNETVYVRSATRLYAVDLRTGAGTWTSASTLTGPGYGYATPPMAAGGGVLAVAGAGTITAWRSVAPTRPGVGLRITSGPEGPTNQSDATIAFRSDLPTAVQQCRLDGGAWSPCASGVSYTRLADGPHAAEVRNVDPATGEVLALAAATWSVDTDVPRAEAFTKAAARSSSTWAGLGWRSSSADARVECRLDAEPWAPCVSTSYEDTSLYRSGLADGQHTWSVRAEDAVGNRQDPPSSVTWTVDTQPPVVTIDDGPSGNTTATDATISFHADEGATFRCALDNAPLAACTSPFHMEGVPLGRHSFQVSATDLAGNPSSSPGAVRTWTVNPAGSPPDDASPPVTTLAGTPPRLTAGTSARFVFAANEYGRFECSLDGSSWAACTSPRDVGGLADGRHRFVVRAIDLAGNVEGTPPEWTWTVDTVPPGTTLRVTGTAHSRTVEVTADEPATFECSLDGATPSACSSGTTFDGLTDGIHTIVAYATDGAGNRDASGARQTVTVGVVPSGGEGGHGPVAGGSPPTGGGAASSAGGPPGAPAAAAKVPVLSPRALARILVAGNAGTVTTGGRAALRRGLRVTVAASTAAKVRLELRHGGTILARAASTFTRSGRRTVTLKLTAAGRAYLRPARGRTVTLRAVVSPQGEAGATASHTLKLR